MKKLLLLLVFGIVLMSLSCKKADIQPGHEYTLDLEQVTVAGNGCIASAYAYYTDTHGDNQSTSVGPNTLDTYTIDGVDDTELVHISATSGITLFGEFHSIPVKWTLRKDGVVIDVKESSSYDYTD